tara:strand:- start:529 stop:1113 length:585 start_codon:yes stop_codon:yes gene_type:complete
MSKLLYLIRHGLALHNENFLKYGEKTFFDPKYVDTHLIEEGIQQSLQFGKTWQNIDDIELVLVSPLYRALETATNIFKNKDVPIISLEELREYSIGQHTCNKRSSKDILMLNFPHINFDDIKGGDYLWTTESEGILSLEKRINNIKNYIKKRDEKVICIVSHTQFLEKMKYNKISLMENGKSKINHCFPYIMNL